MLNTMLDKEKGEQEINAPGSPRSAAAWNITRACTSRQSIMCYNQAFD